MVDADGFCGTHLASGRDYRKIVTYPYKERKARTMYEMTITKTFGNKKSIKIQTKGKDKIDAMFCGLAQAAQKDPHNFKHIRYWQVEFINIKKIA